MILGADEISHGGAIYVLNEESSSVFYLEHSFFIDNMASHGGAIHFLARKGKEYGIANTEFDGNSATVSGGAIVTRNKNVSIYGNRFRRNKAFTGGAVMLVNDAGSRFDNVLTEDLKVTYNYFISNIASDGGAVAAIGAGVINTLLNHIILNI